MTAHRSGLERLQNLDEDFETIEERIEAVKDVLGLELVRSTGKSDPDSLTQVPPSVDWSRQGQTEFAFRWLLNSLRSSSDARGAPECWTLFASLALSLPSAAASRSLAASKLPTILQDALEQVAKNSGVEAADDNVELAAKQDKKRKQEGKKSKKLLKNDGDTRKGLALFLAVASAVRHLSTSRKRDRQGRSKDRTLFPSIGIEQAAQLLGAWLKAITSLCKVPTDSSHNIDLDTTLKPILGLWEMSVTNATMDQSVGAVFTKQCLCPALLYLQQATALQPKSTTIDVKGVKQLLIDHVLAPARRSFNDKSSQDADQVETLRALLQPLSLALVDSQSQQRHASSIAMLYRIAAEHYLPARSTPKRKMAERSWLEAVFKMLCECRQIKLDEASAGSGLADQQLLDLQELLTLSKTYRISISPVILRKIGDSYGNLDIRGGVRWSLLAAILALDNQAFLEDSALDKIMEAVGSSDIQAPAFGRRNKNKDSQTQTYDVVKKGVIIPLMRAHATSRKLIIFMQQWQHNLMTLDLESEDARSVWEDFELKVDLAELLESSLTTKQVLQLVSEFAADVSVSELEGDSRHKCLASAVILQALLYAMRSEETRQAVLPICRQVFERSIRLLFSDRVRSPKLGQELWRLSSSTFLAWSSQASVEELMSSPLISSRSPALALCGTNFHSAKDNLEALACLSSMLENLNSRHIDCKNVEAGVRSALNCYMATNGDGASLAATEYTFFTLIDRFPGVLQLCRQKGEQTTVSERDILQRLVTSALKYDARVGSSASRSVDLDFLRTWLPFVKSADSTTRKIVVSLLRQHVTETSFLTTKPNLVVDDENHAQIFAALSLSQYKPTNLPKDLRAVVQRPALLPKDTRKDEAAVESRDLDGILKDIKEDKSDLKRWALLHRHLRGIKTLRQPDFDAIVSLIHAMTLKREPSTPSHTTANTEIDLTTSRIYHGLTELTHILLSRHRRRFRERYPLLIALLQSLLRCLFVARPAIAGSTLPAFALQQPTWLSSDPRHNPLTTRHAEHFTRLVTTLCDPALSSVQHRRRDGDGANLRDPTRTARMYAGQYAPYLLLSLCTCQLEGLFAEEGMREALRVGVFAMFDAMGKEIQETVHRTWEMNGAVRTLFRAWWDEWSKERERRVA